MAVAPAAGILAMLELLMVSIVALMLFEWLVHSLVGWIPFIGNKASAAASSVSSYVERKTEAWLYPQLHTLLNWFEVLAARVLDFPHSIVEALSGVDSALKHLVETKIPQMIHAGIHQLRLDVDYLQTTTTGLVADVAAFPNTLTTRLNQFKSALDAEVLAKLRTGIDRLERDVVRPGDAALHREIGAARSVLDRDITAARDLARGAEADLAKLAARLDIPVGLLETMIATIGIAAAADAIETLGRCSPKLRKMCTSDPAQWARLIEGLALLALWPGLVDLTKMAQGILEAHHGRIHDLIVNGGPGG